MKKAVISLGLLAMFFMGLQHKTCLVISESASLPWRAYLVIKGSSWKKGDIVTIQGHEGPYVKEPRLLTKRIAGVAGDPILLEKQTLRVGQQKIGSLMSKTSTGKPLHPVEKRVIPSTHVFLAGDHPKSFDSRYEEFGLVHTRHILGRSIPLW